jgi:hypothetical protein
VPGQLAGGRGHEHLAAMARGRQAGGLVERQANEARLALGSALLGLYQWGRLWAFVLPGA